MPNKNNKIIIHICCAVCGVYLVEVLKEKFDEIILYFFNPNIYPKEEYLKRLESVKKLAEVYSLELIEGDYLPQKWLDEVRGMEKEPEGGKRCEVCFKYRLKETCKVAKEKDIDFFTTTLSASNFKDEKLISLIGDNLAKKYSLDFIDLFKDKDFKKSALQKARELSKKYNFYHQKYCGCVFSQRK